MFNLSALLFYFFQTGVKGHVLEALCLFVVPDQCAGAKSLAQSGMMLLMTYTLQVNTVDGVSAVCFKCM